jgi:HAD superfamily hydrolase (TIGR01509 family)
VAEFGGEWTDEKAHSLVGKDLRDSAAIIRDLGGVDLPIDDIVNRLLDGVIARVRHHVPWRPGAKDTLAALRAAGVPTALVTMSWRRFAEAVVTALPPGSFTVVITGDEVSNGKPHPEPYLAAAAALGVRAKDCVAIEDSPTGVRSAVAAGCRTIAVPNVVGIPDGKGYTRYQSLVDIPPATLGLTTAPVRRTRRRLLPLIALAALLIGAVGAAVLLRAPKPQPPLADIPFSAWAPYWTLADATGSVSAHGTLLHEVSPFWYEATGAETIGLTGNISPEQSLPLIAAIRDTGGKVVPSVSDAMPAGGMAGVLADAHTRTQHVRALAQLVSDNGYDGLDLDYEQFAFTDDKATWETTRGDWVAFVTELADVLHAQDKLLTVSVPPIYDTGRTADSGYWVYDYAAMSDVVDRIRIMGYDYSVGEPGPIAPLDWVRSAVRAAKKAVGDDSKLVLGVGLYGRNWVVATKGTCPASAEGTTPVTQRSVQELATKRNAVPVHDPATQEASFTYQLDVTDAGVSCTQTREVHYIDEEGARARVDLARQERIGGVAFWALGFDSEAMWAGVSDVARPRT